MAICKNQQYWRLANLDLYAKKEVDFNQELTNTLVELCHAKEV